MTQRHVLIVCDLGQSTGLGHLFRGLAVAQQAIKAGWKATVAAPFSDLAFELIKALAPEASTIDLSKTSMVRVYGDLRFDVVHIDSYDREMGFPVDTSALRSVMQDGLFGARSADLHIDANYGAENSFVSFEEPTAYLVGAEAVLIREQVLKARDSITRKPVSFSPRVLVVLGGTDATGTTAQVVKELLKTSEPLRITAICPLEQQDSVVSDIQQNGHELVLLSFAPDLPSLVARQDLVVSAAGTSIWDFLCIGVPIAIIPVVENQRESARQVVSQGLAFPLVSQNEIGIANGLAEALGSLRNGDLILNMREQGQALIDGLGPWRVVKSWEQLLEYPIQVYAPSGVEVRLATLEDAQKLFDWRSDPLTRSVSRETSEIPWEHHCLWLKNSIGSTARKLLIAESDGVAIGTVRWDKLASGEWEVSIALDPGYRGVGLASKTLAAAENWLQLPKGTSLIATVSMQNHASLRLFARFGYLPHSPEDSAGFTKLRKVARGEGAANY